MRLRATKTLTVEPWLPAELEPLRGLSRNLHWAWSTDAVHLFHRIGGDRWPATSHNPVRLLQTTSRDELEQLAHDDGYLEHQRRVVEAFDAYMQRPPHAPIEGLGKNQVIAYFSFEFALTESFATYSGGLGVLAGDHLKSASDLGLPLVGMSLFYRQGYFKQVFAPDGYQKEEYHQVDPAHHPLTLMRDETGTPLTIAVPFEGRDVLAAIWRLAVGQVPLYLLDSDVEGNSPADRAIASRLYGGDSDTRIAQEMLLGIGGIRALRALGMDPVVCHMNEGHSSLLAVDRIRGLMEETGASFEEARLPVAAGTVFTTHTAVAAGIDLFPPDLVRRYLGHYYSSMGLDERTFIGLGRMHPDDANEPFSMALLGLRLSGFRNGVSKLHGAVSRRLWLDAWPSLPEEQVPITSITNGVHLPTWVSHEIGDLYDRYVGPHWRDDPLRSGSWDGVASIPDEQLWNVHERQREELVRHTRAQVRDSQARRGLAVNRTEGEPLQPHALTIGFARRFAGYKRATLLFRDLDRLAAILNNAERPVQIVFAGKAHPKDEIAKQLMREVVTHSRRPELRHRLLVLDGYDVEMARALVQGCDIWLNTPLRPLEASGTSGMKAVANGALHVSVLDGWWAEAYRPGLGWTIGRDDIEDDPEVQDAFDANSLYSLLEDELAPMFYDRDGDGLPREWIGRMKASMEAFAPIYSTQRMVDEYAERAYEPAVRDWTRLRADDLAPAQEFASWLGRMRAGWDGLKVLSVEDDARDGTGPGEPVTVLVQAHWGELSPGDLCVEALHGPALSTGELDARSVLELQLQSRGEDGLCRYSGAFVPSASGRTGYVLRITARHPQLGDAHDASLVAWA